MAHLHQGLQIHSQPLRSRYLVRNFRENRDHNSSVPTGGCPCFWYPSTSWLPSGPQSPNQWRRESPSPAFTVLWVEGLRMSSCVNKVCYQVTCAGAGLRYSAHLSFPGLAYPSSLFFVASSDKSSLVFSGGFLLNCSQAPHPVHRIYDASLNLWWQIYFCIYSCPSSPSMRSIYGIRAVLFIPLYSVPGTWGVLTKILLDGWMVGQTDTYALRHVA